MSSKAILCVDDEVIVLLSLRQELKKTFGDTFIYEQATNAEIALEIIDELYGENIRIILIISDWLMPGMKGDEFLELVNNKHPDIKAIMITGQADEEVLEKMEQNSYMISIMKKPWDSRELIKLIEDNCVQV